MKKKYKIEITSFEEFEKSFMGDGDTTIKAKLKPNNDNSKSKLKEPIKQSVAEDRN